MGAGADQATFVAYAIRMLTQLSSSQFLARTASSDSCPARFDLDHLADFSLNGREIKHAVQTAQAIALMEDEELEMKHIEEVVSVARSGARQSLADQS